MTFSSANLAELLDAELTGEPRTVACLSSPERSGPDAAVVLFEKPDTLPEAAVLVVRRGAGLSEATPHIEVPDPKQALARLSRQFDTRHPVAEGQHPSAVIHSEAKLAEDVHIGPGAVIGAGAQIGAGSRVGARVVIGPNVIIGPDCRLHPGVTLYEGTVLGARVTLHSGAVIGADGFGYVASDKGVLKVHHLGGVVLADDVEIGANTCVDRGTLNDTRIGPRSKIDNLCQIGHNVVIGSDCFMAGSSAVGGSTVLGDRVVVGGSVGIIDHLSIGDGVQLGARALVRQDIPAGQRWLGHPAKEMRAYVRDQSLLTKLEAFLHEQAALKDGG